MGSYPKNVIYEPHYMLLKFVHNLLNHSEYIYIYLFIDISINVRYFKYILKKI